MPVTPKTAGGERGESEVSQASRAYPDLSHARDRFHSSVRYMYGSEYARDACDTPAEIASRRGDFGVTGIFAAPVTPVTPDPPDPTRPSTAARGCFRGGAVKWGVC